MARSKAANLRMTSTLQSRSLAGGAVFLVGGALALVACAPGATRPALAETVRVAEPHAVTVGMRAPALALERVDGKGRVSLPNGKVTVVTFWSMDWGGQYALPKLEELHRRLAEHGLELIVISHDDERRTVVDTVERYTPSYALVWDEGRKVISAWKPDRVMSVYVLDRDGIVRLALTSGKESVPTALPGVEEKLRELLGVAGPK